MKALMVIVMMILTVALSVSENKKAEDRVSLAYQTNFGGDYR